MAKIFNTPQISEENLEKKSSEIMITDHLYRSGLARLPERQGQGRRITENLKIVPPLSHFDFQFYVIYAKKKKSLTQQFR